MPLSANDLRLKPAFCTGLMSSCRQAICLEWLQSSVGGLTKADVNSADYLGHRRNSILAVTGIVDLLRHVHCNLWQLGYLQPS